MNVRRLYEVLEEILDNEGGAEVHIASQPGWPLDNLVDNVQVVESYVDHPFAGYDSTECQECGGHTDDELHQLRTEVYIVEGDQVGYLSGDAADQIGWSNR